jgi:hypothetical protein
MEIETKVFADYALVVCSGRFSIAAMLRVYEEAFEFAIKSDRAAVLIDGRNVTGREPRSPSAMNRRCTSPTSRPGRNLASVWPFWVMNR